MLQARLTLPAEALRPTGLTGQLRSCDHRSMDKRNKTNAAH